MTQQIEQHLGPFHMMRPFLEETKRLIGVDGPHPPPSPAPVPSCASSRLQAPPPEFKKPPQQSSHHQGVTRGGFVKPQDGKPPYGGRGGYPGQPVKHGGSNDQRSNSIVPPKGPPNRPNPHHIGHDVHGRNRMQQQQQQVPKSLPRYDPLDCPVDIEEPPTPATREVENILKVSAFSLCYLTEFSHYRSPLSESNKNHLLVLRQFRRLIMTQFCKRGQGSRRILLT